MGQSAIDGTSLWIGSKSFNVSKSGSQNDAGTDRINASIDEIESSIQPILEIVYLLSNETELSSIKKRLRLNLQSESVTLKLYLGYSQYKRRSNYFR